MKSYRENPEGEENAKSSKENEREIQRLKMRKEVADELAGEFDLSKSEEVPCPNCYGGHFRPCQWCGDTGRVTNIPNKTP